MKMVPYIGLNIYMVVLGLLVGLGYVVNDFIVCTTILLTGMMIIIAIIAINEKKL